MAPITEKLVKNSLRWFAHVQRRPIDASVRMMGQTTWSLIKKMKGRLRQTLGELNRTRFIGE